MIKGIAGLKIEEVNKSKTKITIAISEGYKANIDNNGKEIAILVAGDDVKDELILNGKKIAIDPGHGGSSSGAVGPSGIKEKNLVLTTSFMIRDLLQKLGAEVVLTRSRDINVALAERVRIANDARADLFISVHYNGFNDPSANGTETFWHTSGSSESRRLANLLQEELLNKLKRRNRGVKQANFYVLRESRMPSALIEPLFVTNPIEEKIISEERNQLKVAEAVINAIVKYFS